MPHQVTDIEYIAMNDFQFGAMMWMLEWSEHRRIHKLREFWRNTYLQIQQLPDTVNG